MNHKSLLAIVFFLFSGVLLSQTQAITEFNDTIYIYDNGTWSFEMDNSIDEVSFLDVIDEEVIIFDTVKVAKSYGEESNKEIASKLNQIKLRFNGEKWKRVPPAEFNEEAEFAFENRNTDIWCIVITEEAEIGSENTFKIAKSTMEERTGSEVKVKKAEHLIVNGNEVLRGTFESTFSGITFIFDSYYYSDFRGTTQITTWTSSNLWVKYQTEIEELLNGLVILEK